MSPAACVSPTYPRRRFDEVFKVKISSRISVIQEKHQQEEEEKVRMVGGKANVSVLMSQDDSFHQKVVLEKRLKIGEVILRFVMFALALVAAVRVGTDTQTRTIFTIEKKAKFSDMKALVFLVVINGIVAAYSLLQGLRCVLSMYTQSPLTSKPLAWLIFALDQTIAYFSIAAAAAAAESAYLAERGQNEFQWMKVCIFYEKFCHQIGEGLVSTFLVSLSMATVSGISAYHLFRLYGPKGKSIQ